MKCFLCSADTLIGFFIKYIIIIPLRTILCTVIMPMCILISFFIKDVIVILWNIILFTASIMFILIGFFIKGAITIAVVPLLIIFFTVIRPMCILLMPVLVYFLVHRGFNKYYCSYSRAKDQSEKDTIVNLLRLKASDVEPQKYLPKWVRTILNQPQN